MKKPCEKRGPEELKNRAKEYEKHQKDHSSQRL